MPGLRILAAMCLALILSGGTARASVITGFSLVDSGSGNYHSLSAATSPSASNKFSSPNTSLRFVNINATATDNPSFGAWRVTVFDNNQNNDYSFTIQLTNQTGADLEGVEVQLSRNYQIEGGALLTGTLTPGAGTVNIKSPPVPTSTWHSSSTLDNDTISFGGLGTLADGETGTLTFTMQLSNLSVTSGTFFFRLTATPEPTSLIFGAVALSLAGGVATVVRRRRKANPADAVA